MICQGKMKKEVEKTIRKCIFTLQPPSKRLIT